ncbi:WXG100 family type VII secretion target [Cohnella panacarvi]|uniref:WXG100 family type VII secretion target n=1 Tax=Cohnella panacarvi TaxID=400776 RepID=UPI00047BEC1A|nr:WXG100 family type VII secretion target [Cohnella panacarvi]
MARKIVVDPAVLVSAAGKMEEQAKQYQDLYGKLFDLVDGLAAEWKGKDNEAFRIRIMDFKPDMETMKANMDKYAAFLRSSGELYQKTQDNVETGAKGLAN